MPVGRNGSDGRARPRRPGGCVRLGGRGAAAAMRGRPRPRPRARDRESGRGPHHRRAIRGLPAHDPGADRARRALVRRSGDHQRRSRRRRSEGPGLCRRVGTCGRETNGQLSGSRSVLATAGPATLYKTVPRPSDAPGAHELYLREKAFVEDFASDLPRSAAARLWASERAASAGAIAPGRGAPLRQAPPRRRSSRCGTPRPVRDARDATRAPRAPGTRR
jgi:hypothetical protein